MDSQVRVKLFPGSEATVSLDSSVPLTDVEGILEAAGYAVRYQEGLWQSGRPSSRGRGCHVGKVAGSTGELVFIARSTGMWASIHPDVETIPAGTPIDVIVL